jgi:hypothetical protein
MWSVSWHPSPDELLTSLLHVVVITAAIITTITITAPCSWSLACCDFVDD